MKTIKKLLVFPLVAVLLSMTVSCNGNKVENYISDSENLVEKWKDKTSGEEALSEKEKKQLRDELIDLGAAQKEIQMDPELIKKITPEQEKRLTDLSMDIAFIAMKSQ